MSAINHEPITAANKKKTIENETNIIEVVLIVSANRLLLPCPNSNTIKRRHDPLTENVKRDKRATNPPTRLYKP